MSSVAWRDQRVLLNGIDYIGQIEKASLEIKRKMVVLTGLAMGGEPSVPTGDFEPLAFKIEFNNISPKDIRSFISNDGYVNITFSGKCLGLDSVKGMVKDSDLVTTIRGYVDVIPGHNPQTDAVSSGEVSGSGAMFIEIKDKEKKPILMIDLANGIIEPADLS